MSARRARARCLSAGSLLFANVVFSANHDNTLRDCTHNRPRTRQRIRRGRRTGSPAVRCCGCKRLAIVLVPRAASKICFCHSCVNRPGRTMTRIEIAHSHKAVSWCCVGIMHAQATGHGLRPSRQRCQVCVFDVRRVIVVWCLAKRSATRRAKWVFCLDGRTGAKVGRKRIRECCRVNRRHSSRVDTTVCAGRC